MGLQLLTSLTVRLLPPLLLLLCAGWISQGHSTLTPTFEDYIEESCGMSRLPDITIKISFAYRKDHNLDLDQMHHWATVNIRDFKYPYYELQNPTISPADMRRFENMIRDAEGNFILIAEAKMAGRQKRSVWAFDCLWNRREYLTRDFILLYINPLTLDFDVLYKNNQTQVGFNPFSSIPKVAFNGFVFVICEEDFETADKTAGPFKYMKMTEL